MSVQLWSVQSFFEPAARVPSLSPVELYRARCNLYREAWIDARYAEELERAWAALGPLQRGKAVVQLYLQERSR